MNESNGYFEDPAELAAYRVELAKDDSSVGSLTDDEFAASLRGTLESERWSPTSADEAADRWSLLAHWDGQVDLRLSDDVIYDWETRAMKRQWERFKRD